MSELEQKFQKRQTACKLRVIDILNSKYVKSTGFIPNYLQVLSQEVSRINIIGVVIEKSEENDFRTIMIDDGTGRIPAKTFDNGKLLENVSIGDVVLLIGKPREFSSNKYVFVEMIKKIDPAWARVRKTELEKNTPTADTPKKNGIVISNDANENKIIDLSSPNRVITLIKELDRGFGVSIEDLSSKNVKEVDKVVDMLLKEGDLFEIKPGKLKVLE